jgi:chaperonin GroES
MKLKIQKARVFEPRQGCLLVEQHAAEEAMKNGIYIPDTAKEKPNEGTVLASHPANQYQKGDILLFRKYAGTDVKLDGAMLLIVPEEDVLGRLA